MARAYQAVKYVNHKRTKKNNKSKGTARRIKISHKSTTKRKGKITIKKKSYSGKPSRLPSDW